MEDVSVAMSVELVARLDPACAELEPEPEPEAVLVLSG